MENLAQSVEYVLPLNSFNMSRVMFDVSVASEPSLINWELVKTTILNFSEIFVIS